MTRTQLEHVCLSPPDLAVSKLAAAREKDLFFVAAMLKHRMVTAAEISSLAGFLASRWEKVVRQSLDLCVARSSAGRP
jgi:hypothetical protein